MAEENRRRRKILSLEQAKRREKQGQFVAELKRQAVAWASAPMPHRYVRAARRALRSGHILSLKVENTEIDLLDWADSYIESMDPLSPVPDDSDQRPNESGCYGSADEELEKAVHRIVGESWLAALKMVETEDELASLQYYRAVMVPTATASKFALCSRTGLSAFLRATGSDRCRS